MRHLATLLLMTSALSMTACVGDSDDDSGVCREATVASDDAMYDRYEGTGADNHCSVDDDCVIGGCSGEICAAEALDSTCEVVPIPSGDCGCVENTCIWYAECS